LRDSASLIWIGAESSLDLFSGSIRISEQLFADLGWRFSLSGR
jgi:hypothetical protein